MTLHFAPSAEAPPATPLTRRLDHLTGQLVERPGASSSGLLLERALTLVAEAEQMLADQRARIAQLERLSMTDELTGLLNRRGLMSHLRRELANAGRHGHAGILALADLDDLKTINDNHGHAAGDAALRRFSQGLSGAVRTGDVVGRLGGDEFALILHRATEAGARRRLEALRRTLAQTPIWWHGVRLSLGASFGVSAFSGADDQDTLIARADRALYADKHRRKTVAAGPGHSD